MRTPEEIAAELVGTLLREADASDTASDVAHCWERTIAAAIRQARAEGMEEAARYIETHRPSYGAAGNRVEPNHSMHGEPDVAQRLLAAAIRAKAAEERG